MQAKLLQGFETLPGWDRGSSLESVALGLITNSAQQALGFSNNFLLVGTEMKLW